MKPFVFIAGLFLVLATAIPFGDFSKAGSVFAFVPLLVAASAFYFGAVSTYPNLKPALRTQTFWLVAIGLRLVALAMPPGDDIHRYLWEGRMQWEGFNPYLFSPESPALAHLRDAHWIRMNHKEWSAIYPPGAELILKGLTIFGPSVSLMKVVFAMADLAVIFLLLRVHTGQSRHRDTVWYAWNPLVVYSFAGAAHFDSLMLASIMLAVYALFRANPLGKSPAHWGWAAFAALSLGLAISIKLVPVILIPVFALALRSRMVVLPLSGLIPLATALYYGFPKNRLFDSLQEFAYVTRFNDFFWWISERFIWANPAQKNGWYTLIAAIITALVGLLAWRDWRRALLWVLGASLIFSTVLHPWYITWILPFAAMRKAYGWFVLSGTVFLAVLWWETTPWWTAWQPSILLSLSISLPPLVFSIYGFVKSRSHHFGRDVMPQPKLQS